VPVGVGDEAGDREVDLSCKVQEVMRRHGGNQRRLRARRRRDLERRRKSQARKRERERQWVLVSRQRNNCF
jgi:hypothetical protein